MNGERMYLCENGNENVKFAVQLVMIGCQRVYTRNC